MHYFEEDLSFFLSVNSKIIYLLSHQKKFLSHITELDNLATKYADLLNEKSGYQYEFLDEFYSINQRVKTFNSYVCEDLISSNQKCAQTAAYYCIMKPDHQYLPHLEKALHLYPEHNFLFHLAYLLNSNNLSNIESIYLNPIIKLQNVYSILPDRSLPLRKSLSYFDLEQLKKEIEEFKSFYHMHTLEQSLLKLKTFSMYPYFLNHRSWLKNKNFI